MSDLNNNEILDEVQLAGEHKLEMRVARLKRFIDLNAPPIILASEIVLIERAMWLAHPVSMAAAIETDRVKSAKKAAGFCISPSCQNHLGSDHEYCDSCMKSEPDEDDDTDDTDDTN